MDSIVQSDIVYEMENRYIDYAMSVIIGRALPDVRDGLKPVHRRIIYAMNELGLLPEKGYRKCARVVGDVLGKYHPHADTGVYDALVRMAQDFSMRYPLVDGHGNFGSVDGDGAAAMRYTESRMQKLTLELLRDINKDTVDFIPNFDGEEQEPSVLPSRFPNLLVNGSEGIAVGMSTSIPPHNLTEVIDGILYLIDNSNCDIKDIVKYIQAPDFPTKATIINPQNMLNIYTEGKGKIMIRSKYHIEKDDKYKRIVFTEIPYQSNKSKICENIANAVISKDNILKSISDVRDESDKEVGMRIVVEMKKSVDEDKILARLFKNSNFQLQVNYNAIFLAIVNNEPKVLNLKEILQHYINHQKEVLTRRTQFDLDKSQKRLHILEGLIKAISNMDKTIELIRQSSNKTMASNKLIEFLNIDQEQSAYILKLELQRLTGFEIETIQKEYNELLKTIDYLNSILGNEQKLLEVLKSELIEVRDKYGDKRKTQIIYEDSIQDISKEDLIEDNTVTLCLTQDQYIKKNLKYSENQKVKDGDKIAQLFQATNKTDLLFFTNQARMFIRKTYEIEECEPSKFGEYIPNILDLQEDEKVIYITATKDWKEDLICVFENGNISRLNLSKIKPQQNRKVAIEKIYNQESPLLALTTTDKDIDILMISKEGKALNINTKYFNAKDSKNTKGNKAMELGKSFEDNKVVFAKANPIEDFHFTLNTKKGKSKEFILSDVAPTNRPNEQRTLKEYITGKNGNQGNFILNTRVNDDEVISVQVD